VDEDVVVVTPGHCRCSARRREEERRERVREEERSEIEKES
jgi:hypothetical protein